MIVPSPRTLIEEVLFSLQYRFKPYFKCFSDRFNLFAVAKVDFFCCCESGKTKLREN
jgi:hypothetical protein